MKGTGPKGQQIDNRAAPANECGHHSLQAKFQGVEAEPGGEGCEPRERIVRTDQCDKLGLGEVIFGAGGVV